LELDKQHQPATKADLKSSLIDIDRLNNNTTAQLCQDLGNMLHMIEQVQEFDCRSVADVDDPVTLYDVPRGVTEAPIQNENSTATTTTSTSSNVAAAVHESLLKPKMIQHGAHCYFEIVTDQKVVVPKIIDDKKCREDE
jgi:Asp-tRNA(Asn)/Glu-tRNA(Gln) amidotransferase C subunit